jgi:FKBP-type peptidyl-prolyl cis-trans isomerase
VFVNKAIAIGLLTCAVLILANSFSGCKSKGKVSESVAEAPIVAQTKPEFQTTASGLKYRVLKAGSGRAPKASNTVTVHYKGWLDNKTTFDSSYSRGPATFPLSDVVKGWTEGLQLVNEGGMIELEVPAELGYGEQGSPPKIPPGATLHFLIELISVK